MAKINCVVDTENYAMEVTVDGVKVEDAASFNAYLGNDSYPPSVSISAPDQTRQWINEDRHLLFQRKRNWCRAR